jgi:outer membrane biosynthesis protein TonB
VFLRLGGRILELEAMLPEDFEAAAAAIGNVDLSTEDAKAALVRVGFRRGYGNLYFAGSPEARTAEDLTPDYEVLAPVLLDSVRPRLPASVDVKGDSVVVELSVLVGKAGGLYDIQLIATPHADLAPIAEETVRNAWRFLPAVSQGKPVDARVTLKVTFQR